MVLFNFYGETRECAQIPEGYYDFTQAIGILFNLDSVDKLILEYTYDSKTYHLLNEETYNIFFLNGKQSTVFIYSSFEETKTYQMQKEKEGKQETEEEPKIEEKEEDEINTESKENDNNDNQEIKVPEVTRDMVIASILKQVKENMQKSRILEKEKKEKEEKEEKERKEKEEK